MSKEHDARREDAFLKGAYELNDVQDAMAFYAEWAEDYDDRMERVLGYVAPRLMADRFAEIAPATQDPILDVGCGTGLTCQYLRAHGFSTVDGVDLNPQMLAKSRDRGVYRNLIEADITTPIDLPSASYQGVISSGTFTLGHVGATPIPELVRLLKPGGILGCTVHREIWEPQGFEDAFAQQESAGALAPLSRTPGEFFTGYGDTAFYCLFKRI